MELNGRAANLCREILADAQRLQIACRQLTSGATVFDFGVETTGGDEAGVMLSRVCLADAAEVTLRAEGHAAWSRPVVRVETDQPVAACMASQYAGWEIKEGSYFAMGSGPMRAAAAREPLFEEIGLRETPQVCVGVLEASKLPTDEVCRKIAEKCGVEAGRLTLLVAPTRSPAGTLQIVARTVETALHKLHELGFDLDRIERGCGIAPLPPLADDDFKAIGRTNDAILYGGQVQLQVHGDDQALQAIGPQIPSSASADYGRPFAELLAGYDNDFYQVDPLLFSPAEVELINVETGNTFSFGSVNKEVLQRSFGQNV